MNEVLNQVKTIVLLMFENRSFDHMLGHLSYEKINKNVNGLKRPLASYENIYKGDVYLPFSIKNDSNLSFDIPHEFNYVKEQIAQSPVSGKRRMNGFVQAYLEASGDAPNKKSPPMGFFPSGLVPITSFLAQEYCVCDNWFCPLPTSTQPNRTMAFCGDSAIHDTKLQLIPSAGNIFDWMNNAGVKWRVYHDGLSFFVLYNGLWKYVLSNQFRDYENLFNDMKNEPGADFPQVIVVEPSYQDAPHIGPDHPNDNHAPLAIGWGEDFLRNTYQAVTANPDRWAHTLFIVYYDEHGGFYDHVAPNPIGYQTKSNPAFSFDSLGPRIPGMLVSPFVKPGAVYNGLLDHTSVLQLLAEKFTPGKPYSATVDSRKQQGITSISAALTPPVSRQPPLAPADPIEVKSALGDNIAVAPASTMGKAFENAAQSMLTQEPANTAIKYPELVQWRDAVAKLRKP